jgi:Zn-dependent metalloprotease
MADAHADAAHRYAYDALRFYELQHGRNGVDGEGLVVDSTVHYGVGYSNAFWNGEQIVYGDGAGWPLADDIVGHELTHAVTQNESGLFYYYQSGAINESFSDIWGELIDQNNQSGTDEGWSAWYIGEDIAGWGPIRSMRNPPDGHDPDRMTSSYYYLGSADNGGVHTNSGVGNKAAYLLTEGGTFNGYTVRGLVAYEKVSAIYYEAQTNLLTSGSDYNDLYYILFQACQNIIGGPDGVADVDCLEVRDATNAVEMNLQPNSTYNPEPDACPAGAIHHQTSSLMTWRQGRPLGLRRWRRGQPMEPCRHPRPWSVRSLRRVLLVCRRLPGSHLR